MEDFSFWLFIITALEDFKKKDTASLLAASESETQVQYCIF